MQRIFILLALTLGALCACGGNDAGAQKMEVRVYQVPPDSTNALVQTLNKVFETSEKSTLGKVSSPSPGQLVVLAPASLQGSVEASLHALTKDLPTGMGAAATKPDLPLRLSFWSVDAVPEAGDDDAALAALAPALDEARKQLGAVHFELRDQVSGVSSAGESVSRTWPGGKSLMYELKRKGGELSLAVTLNDVIGTPGHYSATGGTTTTWVRPGQTLILSQIPVPDSEAGNASPANLTRLYLVRVDEVAAP
ncbi:MAG: hypothetical protein ABI843_05425 [Dokdonella sp.]